MLMVGIQKLEIWLELADSNTGNVRFFVSRFGNSTPLESVDDVIYMINLRSIFGREEVSVLLNRSVKSPKSVAPIAEYLPALKEAKLLVEDYKLQVLCYATKDLSLKKAVSNLIIPGLVDQICTMKNTISPNLLGQHPLVS
ncbi:hypothetical protein Vadar_026204 [Vaccinium darrowii]|uniref:Uncharacterized protein n=1 Tax=Vaccinium darrowii TaxID=229202 RepID=A0ACB7ZMU9_9ERIC|nr:hypothetical protein Vadar_026204 [Vaccinium darrowii]